MKILGHSITIAVSVTGLNETTQLESVIIYSENHTELQRQTVEVYSDYKENIAVADFKVPFQVKKPNNIKVIWSIIWYECRS